MGCELQRESRTRFKASIEATIFASELIRPYFCLPYQCSANHLSFQPRPPNQTPDESVLPEPKTPASRLSATTIDVPLFLQPIAYDPASALPLPGPRLLLPQDDQTAMLSPPEPERLPPPPPQKIPLRHTDIPQAKINIPQRPLHDPQHSYDDGQRKNSQMSQRLHFGPENSHDAGNRSYQWQSDKQRPTIPVPQFTSFDVESALPPPRSQPELSLPQQQIPPRLKPATQTIDLGCHKSGTKSSVSPADPSTADRRIQTSTSWGTQTTYDLSPEQQQAAFSLPDGQSVSTTDLSINTATVSTAGSHQTSNTSYRENEHGERIEQQGGDSFYWHSGRSSSEPEEDQDQSGSPTATPGGDNIGQSSSATDPTGLHREHQDLPIRSTSLSPTRSATYGASALGFGGPSDWEYFGDYEAEEIDDEELYSRPRLRDLKSVIEGSTELPADPALDSVQPLNNETDLPGLDLIRLGNQSLHGTSPSKPLKERSSHENAVQDIRISGEDDYGTNGKLTPERGPITVPAASSPAVSSTDTHGQQRPDLDDVIRAWSEAPYVGKVHEVPHVAAVVSDNKEEPAIIAEASLASAPCEKVLGVDATSQDSVDFSNLDEQELQHDVNVPATPTDAFSNVKKHECQVQSLLDQQESAAIGTLGNAEAKHRKEEQYTSESEETMQAVLLPADMLVSSGPSQSTHPGSRIDEKSSEVSYSQDRFTDSRAPDLPQASRERMQLDSDAKSCESFQVNRAEQGHQMLQNMVHESSQSKNQEHCKRNSEDVKLELPHTSGGNTSHEGIMMVVASTSIESLSREDSLSRSLIVPSDTAPEESSPYTSCNTSGKDPNAGNSIKLRPDDSQDDVKTPITQATSDGSPSEDSATGAPVQATLSHHTGLMEVGAVQDPYSDLEPWGKASLNRFAAMLREESRAETNQDKLNIFNVFTSRESRLRVVLYGTDDELIIPQKSVRQKVDIKKPPEKVGFVKQAVERANSIGLERSLKALPALPTNRESMVALPRNAPATSILQHGLTSNGQVVGLKTPSSGNDMKVQSEIEMPSRPSADDSYVLVDPPSDRVHYSPGGRPIGASLPKTVVATDVESSQDAKLTLEKDGASSSGMPGNLRHADSPSSNGPIAVGIEDLGVPRKPAYRPLIYNEGHSEVKNYLTNRKSVCRPYATLTHGSLESTSTFGKAEDVELAGATSILSAPTSQYNPILQDNVDGVSNSKKHEAPSAERPTDLRRFVKADFDPLLLALPNCDAVVHVSARILDLRNVMDAVPDDFSFIHQSVVAWDAKAKQRREDNDRQRHARQAESEQKIDLLFDDHEIGYGDIAELETEFKRSEAARKADEDRLEYQTFVTNVFNLVWTRLHYELDQLIPHYDQYSRLMDYTLAGKDMFEGSKEGLALGPTMSSFLALHQKIEIRHQKAFEAVLERDRRLKKTEISPWYSLSNIAKVKQLEKQFEDAEKRAIIDYCLQRDGRANHLMDVLDQNTLRGVGANQDYMEAIMKAVRRIASGRAFASVPGKNEPSVGIQEVEKAKAITALLASSSEQVVQTFHVADMLLNSADYEVSVANAKVTKADMATLAKLKEERAKEDQKLMRDLEHRLALIREDTRRTNDEIAKLMLFLGIQNGRADSVPVQAESIDPQHEARMQKALEAAKRRNALKESER